MLSSIINSIPGVAALLPILFVANAIMSGVSLALEKLEAMGKVDAAGSIASTIGKIAGMLKTVTDFFSANVKH